jgi:hypothetical protein
MYGAEVWQIPTREINKILFTVIYVLHRWKEYKQPWQQEI